MHPLHVRELVAVADDPEHHLLGDVLGIFAASDPARHEPRDVIPGCVGRQRHG
jgi:hypothetical protein